MAKIDFNASKVAPAQGELDVHSQPGRVWSVQQNDFFNFVTHGVGNAVLEAVAGSGKSTTGVEAVRRLPAGASHIYLAFNKPIQLELEARGVNARTFHSLCYSPVTRYKKTSQVENNKLRRVRDSLLTGDENKAYGSFIDRMVGLGRNMGIGCLLPDIEPIWTDLMIAHDIELDEEKSTNYPRAIELCSVVLSASNASPLVDFDDLLYCAVREGIVLPKFDYIFLDEAQDTNPIQRALVRKLMHPNSRMFAVGDSAQSIYAFRGADNQAMNLIAEEFNCTKLPLSVTYRCPQSVVKYAHQWVTNIQAAPRAPEGIVEELGTDWTSAVFQPDDLVVCRTTNPLIKLAYKLLKDRVPVRIQGKDVGQGLKTLINKMNVRTLDQLEERLQVWAERESQKAIAKMEDAKAEAIKDKADAILFLIQTLDEQNRTVYELTQVIDMLFAEGTNKVVLATIHKAKGLEADRVFWLNRSKCPSRWARQESAQQQERNLCYVATTRAKKELYLIEEKV